MNAVIYCRVSTDRQMTEGHGIDSQEKRCKDWCQKNNHEVGQIFRDEGISGSIGERPAIRDMLVYLTANPHTIVVIDDIKRLARDVKVFLLLKESIQSLNCTIHYLNHSFEDSPEGQFIQTILAGAAQLERQQNARQVTQKMKSRLEEGYWVFQAPLGYKFALDGKNKVMVKSEANPFVKEGLEKLSAGLLKNVKEYYLYLNDRLPKVSQSQAYKSITDVKYAGYLEFPAWEVPIIKAQHEATISLPTFEKIQQRLKNYTSIHQKSKLDGEFVLRGYVNCAYCGKKLTAYISKGKYNRYPYYSCKNPICNVKDKTIAKEKLESEFIELLKNVQPTEDLLNRTTRIFETLWNEYTNGAKKAQQDLKRELNLIEEEIKKVIDKITNTESDLVSKALENKVEDLEKKRLQTRYKLESFQDHAKDFRTPLKRVMEFIKDTDSIWINGSTDERKMLLNLVFDGDLWYDLNSGFRTPHLSSLYSAFQGVFTLKNSNGGP